MQFKLIKKITDAEGTKSYFWKSDKKLSFLPGQYLYFTLPKLLYDDPKGATRHLTISSSPTELSLIRITTRIREVSGFKKTLNELKIGDTISSEGPNGTFILDENEKGNHVLIAGGIGITPFRSFIKYNIDKKLEGTNIHLIYSNSRPEKITFKNELMNWSEKYHNIKLIQTITQPNSTKNELQGLTGRIDDKVLKSLLNEWGLNINNTKFWVCGPPDMVEAMEVILGNLKVTSNKLRSEKFTGY